MLQAIEALQVNFEEVMAWGGDPDMEDSAFQEAMAEYVEELQYSVLRQYRPELLPEADVNARKSWLRMSSLGKPAILQLLQAPHIQKELMDAHKAEIIDVMEKDERRSLMFHLGDWFEGYFRFLLRRFGWEIYAPPDGAKQWEFTLDGVTGHGDIIASPPGDSENVVVFECKAMASYLVKNMVSDPWGEKPEYVTQASCYAHCFREMFPEKQVHAVIAALALDERRVHYIDIDPQTQEDSVRRARKLIEVLPTIESFTALEGVIKPPPGTRPVYRNKEVAEPILTPPKSLRYADPALLALFYEVTEASYKAGRYNKKVVCIGHVEPDGTEVTHYRRPEL